MQSRALNHPLLQAQPKLHVSKPSSLLPLRHSLSFLPCDNDGWLRNLSVTSLRLCRRLVPRCVTSDRHRQLNPNYDPVLNGNDGDGDDALARESKYIMENESVAKTEELAGKSFWVRIKEVMLFSGPAMRLWICAPLMSLISTAIIGQGSSTELAALGPGTVFCDNKNLLFMFLSIATSNMVATSLAKADKKDVQHQISILLSVGLACGTLMLLFTQFLGSQALTAFSGPKNLHIVPVSTNYVKIRGLAWPAVLYGLVAQSSRYSTSFQ